ncbi:MAG: acyl dehydratase [Parvibaculaceae bacterium]
MTVAEQAFYTGISGNLHPLYVNALHAEAATGGAMVVFELALASLATTALASLGGPGRCITSISLRFPSHAEVGDTIEARAEILAVDGLRLSASIRCAKQDGVVVAEGEAELGPPGGGAR